jgi:hypothetical protein
MGTERLLAAVFTLYNKLEFRVILFYCISRSLQFFVVAGMQQLYFIFFYYVSLEVLFSSRP